MRYLLLILLFQCAYSLRDARQTGGIGFAFSGAGGRIAQHLALMENLLLGLNPAGIKVRPDYISGASSGAISAVALNAILYNEDHNNETGFDLDMYKRLVFELTNGNIYDNSYEGIAKIFAYNIFQGYFLDNTPLKTFMAYWLGKMNFEKLGDLYIPTSLSIVNQTSGDSIRLWSDDPQYADLDLLEIIIASTSIPMAFSPATITGFGNVPWIDGGTGIDTLPVYSLLHDVNITSLYIICYGGAFTSGGADLPEPLNDILLLSNGIACINDMRVDLFNGGVDIAARSSVPSYLYVPTFTQQYSALDFDHEYEEYNITREWALKNNPLPLNNPV